MSASSGVRFALRALHAAHAVTRFIHAYGPPRDAGTMCSACSARTSWTRRSHGAGHALALFAASLRQFQVVGIVACAPVWAAFLKIRLPRFADGDCFAGLPLQQGFRLRRAMLAFGFLRRERAP